MTYKAGKEPRFLSREEVELLHQDQLQYGGLPGIREDHLLESALAAPQNLHHYTQADHVDIASAYAFHIAGNHAFVDGNKRTGMAAATAYLESNGIDASRLPETPTYDAMIAVVDKTISREELSDFLRASLQPELSVDKSQPAREETFAEELRRKAREQGQELRDRAKAAELEQENEQEL